MILRRLGVGFCAALGLIAAAGTAGPAAAGPSPPALLVTFADTPDAATARARLGDLGALRPTLPEAGIWTLAAGAEPAAQARRLALRHPGVRSVDVSRARIIDETRQTALPLPDPRALSDPLFRDGSQWGLGSGFWSPQLTARPGRPRVAVLDGGIDVDHEEWRGPDSPLVHPRSVVRRSDDVSDWGRSGHGTHVAGVAAAPANGVGIVGVAPAQGGAAELIPVQIADATGFSDDETIIRGIRWAVTHDAKVISISAGGPGYSQAFQNTVYWATERGALIVASVGNEGDGGVVNYPAGYAKVLGVGAQCDGTISLPDCPAPFGVAEFSNRNRTADLIAPGVNVLSSVPIRVAERRVLPGYALKNGTSMATPYVAGAAALVLANHTELSPYQVMRQLLNTATDLAPAGRDPASGLGVVNPAAAVTLDAPPDDPFEVNDDVRRAHRLAADQLTGEPVVASIDRFDDPDDVYAVRLRRGQRIAVSVALDRGAGRVELLPPGVRSLAAARASGAVLAVSAGTPRSLTLRTRARRTGEHYIDLRALAGATRYRLTIALGGG